MNIITNFHQKNAIHSAMKDIFISYSCAVLVKHKKIQQYQSNHLLVSKVETMYIKKNSDIYIPNCIDYIEKWPLTVKPL